MDRKSSDPIGTRQTPALPKDARVYAVASDKAFYQRFGDECVDVPARIRHYQHIEDLLKSLGQFEKINLAFVLLIEQNANMIDTMGLRQLRLDFPQVVPLAIVDYCDEQNSMRLQSVGIQRILLPPFAALDINTELATASPNVSQFKRHPDLMKRAQARLDFLIPSDLSYVLGINYEVSLLLKEFGFPLQDSRVNIPLVCDEAITNAVVHGNKSNPEKKVNIQIYLSHSRFRMRIRDQGEGFVPEEVADPLAEENLLRSSGRGIFLMRNIMDSVQYKEDGRVLELEKRNPNAEGPPEKGNGK